MALNLNNLKTISKFILFYGSWAASCTIFAPAMAALVGARLAGGQTGAQLRIRAVRILAPYRL
jgi:hypothetical protein